MLERARAAPARRWRRPPHSPALKAAPAAALGQVTPGPDPARVEALLDAARPRSGRPSAAARFGGPVEPAAAGEDGGGDGREWAAEAALVEGLLRGTVLTPLHALCGYAHPRLPVAPPRAPPSLPTHPSPLPARPLPLPLARPCGILRQRRPASTAARHNGPGRGPALRAGPGRPSPRPCRRRTRTGGPDAEAGGGLPPEGPLPPVRYATRPAASRFLTARPVPAAVPGPSSRPAGTRR